MDEHFEIWGGWCDDSSYGVDAEFLETAMSITEARKACADYR